MSINREMDKNFLVYSYNKMIVNNKNNKLLICTTTLMTLKEIKMSQRNQTQRRGRLP